MVGLKMTKYTVLICAVLISELILQGVAQSQDKEDWIDPFDMINFDHASGKMTQPAQKAEAPKKAKEVKSTAEAHVPLNGSGGMAKNRKGGSVKSEEVQTTTSQTPHNNQQRETIKNTSPPERPAHHSPVYKTLYRKHVKMLLAKWNSQASEGDVAVNMVISLSTSDLSLLRSFCETGHGHASDVDEILQKMIIRVDLPNSSNAEGYFEVKALGISLSTLIQILAIIALLCVILRFQMTLKASWFQILIKLVFLMFFISVPWTWYHMYKQEEARQQSELMKNIPEVCLKRKLAWYELVAEYARSAFTLSEDQCARYYEQMLVDPFWRVAPTEALAVATVRFFVSPMKHIGKGLSEFIREMFQHLPVILWPVILVCGMIILILLLLFVFGYSIRVPFFLSIESSQSTSLKHRLEVMTAQASSKDKQIEALLDKLQRSDKEHLSITSSAPRLDTVLDAVQGQRTLPESSRAHLSISDGNVQDNRNCVQSMRVETLNSDLMSALSTAEPINPALMEHAPKLSACPSPLDGMPTDVSQPNLQPSPFKQLPYSNNASKPEKTPEKESKVDYSTGDHQSLKPLQSNVHSLPHSHEPSHVEDIPVSMTRMV
ncbi:chloride channel CLIC-like protein 1 [Liolophura sinensis]|uniref:chloride channel CLIC-like protein 1 n=1 Tax=Liolophura sinensis TaxID=3198878 RepID=UPI003158044D